MTTPREQKEMVLKYDNRTEFADAFCVKYKDTMPILKLSGRIRSLWDCRATHADELALIHKQEEEEKHMIMIPKRIISKHKAPTNALPDIGEIQIRTNNLLAEMVQLQKEQIAIFKELKELKK